MSAACGSNCVTTGGVVPAAKVQGVFFEVYEPRVPC